MNTVHLRTASRRKSLLIGDLVPRRLPATDSMRMRLRGLLAALILLFIAAACADSTLPEPRIGAGDARANEDYVLEPVIVVGTPKCDPYLSLNWCQGSGGGTCMTSLDASGEMQTVQGCYTGGGGGGGGGGTGGGGGGGTTSPTCPDYGCSQPEPEPDPCLTGDAKLDDPDVYTGFESLWANSNYSAQTPQTERREQAAWLVQGTGGYTLVPITNAAFGPCSVNIFEWPPAGAVSVVHTHPFRVGEVTTTCADYPALYTGTPSDDDRATLTQFGFSEGYILDATGIGRFTASGGESAQRQSRCGY